MLAATHGIISGSNTSAPDSEGNHGEDVKEYYFSLVFALHKRRITSDPGRVSRHIHLMASREFFLTLCTENIGFPRKSFKHSLAGMTGPV